MSSKDRDVWCDKRTWVRPSPFEHALPYCPDGLKLVELDYNVVRCVACHFGPPQHRARGRHASPSRQPSAAAAAAAPKSEPEPRSVRRAAAANR
ncbi:hypothetical protein CH35J_008719 [Colletotrichum higginsianum]|uniref:Uncharacterized protein n=1 Tax=Colletotrichum higginsianum TaxID=80884 RepID=A0A4T0VRM8_9PEZI|nr:hypothetical protein CH35J_008719 [Colletotrichum higginsianum]